jgi:hypothetical protein
MVSAIVSCRTDRIVLPPVRKSVCTVGSRHWWAWSKLDRLQPLTVRCEQPRPGWAGALAGLFGVSGRDPRLPP